jgi:membrane protease YdiL (CAAX protease family)
MVAAGRLAARASYHCALLYQQADLCALAELSDLFGDRLHVPYTWSWLFYLLLRNAATPFPIPFRLAVPSSKSLSVALAGAAILIAANVVGVTFFRHLDAHSWRLTRFPAPTNLALQFFDVTAGVVLAAICEEIVFRFYFMNLFLLRGASMRMTIVLSTLIFAAIHWSYGASTAIFAASAGLLFSIGFIGTGNLAVPIIAHAIFDAVFFAGGIDALWRIYNQA